ncbi:TraB domain-containing protein [Eumeta japonica]|uniref:TraB domain-containing protein n=1 Tax=Eumeta variegata TaxID=151549 RepID=A0A4C1XLS2_EUMVA|nr:TraB domain-containing protein [Eumeta japonica]
MHNRNKKTNLANECQMFIKAEDGGGDTHKSLKSTGDPHDSLLKNTTEQHSYPVTSTPESRKESPSENLIADSNPECDIEGVPDLPLDKGLPNTVTVLDAPDGGKVYLVGTAHFSLESQDDVSRVIQEVKPHIVMVELCEQRTNILLLNEEVILREAKKINIKRVRRLMMELEGGYRNSVIKRRNPIEFGLV